MPLFYVDFALIPDRVVELHYIVVRHLNVLRVKNTEEIVLFKGNGKAYPALPEVLEKRRAIVRILREEATDNESPL
ncbi:RNA methyltransferase PUA domain-containing protein, partial [Neisseria sp. P0001.S008]|uniref:RNA methyltransferase PUA domain-containing protein n=1 Tax=Neisseria sp. P0001.S008 TaxID=3436652 RepID=UPI003F7E3E76